MLQTLNLFEGVAHAPTLDWLVEKAQASIARLFLAGHPVVIAYSGGKDSSVCASLVLTTAKDLVESGKVSRPYVLITTSNTLIENPEVEEHYRKEHQKMEAYGEANGFEVYTKTVTPSLASTFQVKVLSGRGMPSFAGTNTDCSQDLKIKPQASYRNNLFKHLAKAGLPEPVTILGTRFDESERRALNMKMRGENALEAVQNADGDLVLSPICMWSTEDVWEFVGEVSSGLRESFTDFEEVKRIYSHAEGTSCAIVADAIRDGLSKRKKGGCGARHGCWGCQQSTDKSLANMIEYDERYAYAAGLHKLNTFIRNTRHDWTRRNWVGRTIRGGYIAIQPDTYHPAMVRELFRYMLQLDFDEQSRAAAAGEWPKFNILPLDMIMAIDALWSLNGLAKPFSALVDYDAVYNHGVRYDIPDVEPVPATKMPDARFLFVGGEWDDSAPVADWTGMRDPVIEGLLELSACAPELMENSRGKVTWTLETERSFDIHAESVAMIEMFELDRLIDMHHSGWPPGGITAGYKWYLQYGALQLSHSQAAEHDEILRRTAFKDRIDLTLDYDIDQLLVKTVAFADLPQEAREAWQHKATTASAQVPLLLAA